MQNKLTQYVILFVVLIDLILSFVQMAVETQSGKYIDNAWASCYAYHLPYMQIVSGEIYCGMTYQGNSYVIPLKMLTENPE